MEKDYFRDLLACPACGGKLGISCQPSAASRQLPGLVADSWLLAAQNLECDACGVRFEAPGGIPNLRLPGGARTDTVREFYEAAPFPGYPPRDSLHMLRARAERSAFARLLDEAISGDARILDVGCGTGQMGLYLARADRVVIGADLSRRALELGKAAARRFGLDRILFVETDLDRPALTQGAFDVVYSSGVIHHTPNPRAAFARLAPLVRLGGMIVLGVYNTFARVPLRLRRVVARWTNFRLVPFDPILRDRQSEPARRAAWLRDQYQHPEEHRHSIAEVQAWFEENSIEYLQTYPSSVFGEEPKELFAAAADNWRLEGLLAQFGWMRTLGHEGGLFFTVGRRRA